MVATGDGVHDADADLDRFDPLTLEHHAAETESRIAALRAIPGEALSADERLDHRAVLGTLEADLHEWREVRSWTFNPSIYPEVAIYGCYLLALRDTWPRELRLRALVSRLAQVRRLLAEGLANLERPAALLVENAIELCAGSVELFEDSIPALASAAPDGLRVQVLAGCAEAARAFADYAGELRARLTSGPLGSFAIGEDAFRRRMAGAHGLEADPHALLAMASEARRRIESDLEELAERASPGHGWQEQLEALEADHPEPESLLDAYRAEVERVKRFVAERRLASAGAEPLEVLPTPAFERPFYPYAAYMQPAPLEPDGRGLFYVTPVDERLDAAGRTRALRRHNRRAIALLVVHEGFPGHHLQFTRARGCGSLARQLYGTPLLCEGWALYCEQMMVEQGFVDDPSVALFQLRDALWRAWRVDIDVRLSRGEWDAPDAIACLVNELGADQATAEAEVRRYAASPTQPTTYLAGREILLDLRARLAARQGAAFDLGRFHDRVLDFGNLSPVAIRDALLEAPPPRPRGEW